MLRKAKVADIVRIQKIINNFASKDLMLPRSLNELYDNIRDFWVCELNRRVIGCAALHVTWQDLAEIKSLAVEQKYQKQGIGRSLVEACIKEAEEFGVSRVFVLTYQPKFFQKFGFRQISHDRLPHKVWVECINCPKFPDCQEVALVKKL